MKIPTRLNNIVGQVHTRREDTLFVPAINVFIAYGSGCLMQVKDLGGFVPHITGMTGNSFEKVVLEF